MILYIYIQKDRRALLRTFSEKKKMEKCLHSWSLHSYAAEVCRAQFIHKTAESPSQRHRHTPKFKTLKSFTWHFFCCCFKFNLKIKKQAKRLRGTAVNMQLSGLILKSWHSNQTSGVQEVCSTGGQQSSQKLLHYVWFWFWEHRKLVPDELRGLDDQTDSFSAL